MPAAVNEAPEKGLLVLLETELFVLKTLFSEKWPKKS